MNLQTNPMPLLLCLTLCSVLSLAGAPAHAQEDASSIAVAITNPAAGTPSYGEFEIAAEVYTADPIAKVEFYVDGKLMGTDTQRPYRALVDLGYENLEHEYKVVVHTVAGATVEEVLVTPAIAVDMELDVELMSLFVTVRRGNQRALDLDRSSFRVFEDGQRQDLVTFERGDVPVTAVVLLDTSESMRGNRLSSALDGARSFVGGLRDLDQAKVVLFSDQPLAVTEFTGENQRLLATLDGATAAGGTAVNDHLYLALKTLEAQPGRPVVVLFSDGTDAHSVLPMEEVFWKARRSQALIYWIQLVSDEKGGGDTISTAWRDSHASKEESQLLAKVVRESGGEIHTITQPEELRGAFEEILAELREQYVLGYYPTKSQRDGSWRKVKVDVRGLGLTVRHRNGYVSD